MQLIKDCYFVIYIVMSLWTLFLCSTDDVSNPDNDGLGLPNMVCSCEAARRESFGFTRVQINELLKTTLPIPLPFPNCLKLLPTILIPKHNYGPVTGKSQRSSKSRFSLLYRGEYNGRSSDIYRPTGVHDRPLLAMVGHHDRSVFSALG